MNDRSDNKNNDLDFSNTIKNLNAELVLRNFSPKTVSAYKYHTLKFLQYTKKNPLSITKSDVRDYLVYLSSSKEVKPATFNLILSSLTFYFENAMKRRMKIDFKRAKLEQNIPTVISREDIVKLIEACSNIKHRLLIEVMYSSGLRVSECLALKIKDLNLDKNYGIVKRGKGNKDRYFMIGKRLKQDIELYLNTRNDNNPYLFRDHTGHLCVRTAQCVLQNAKKKAHLNYRVYCHALRSSFATHLLEDGVDIHTVQKLLGHSNIRTTLAYIRYSPKQLQSIRNPLDRLLE